MTATLSARNSLESWLGDEAEYLFNYTAKFPKDKLHLPSPDVVDRIYANSDRNPQVLRSLQQLYSTGRLANTGYMSILPLDQGIEHSAAASFAPNPMYFDPENIIKLAIESGCNAVATTLGVLGIMSRKYAHHIPFIVKLNHNELLTYPNPSDQIMFANVEQAWNLGATAVGATIYFGSIESSRQIQEVRQAFARAHELGMATILWCYLRNDVFKQDTDYHVAADLTGQANHLGVTIEADIIKQKLPECDRDHQAVTNATGKKYGLTDDQIYTEYICEI
jgi:class I fructose-bisphosphate aldolase